MDASRALEMEGVKDFVSVDDVPGSNITGGLLSLQGIGSYNSVVSLVSLN